MSEPLTDEQLRKRRENLKWFRARLDMNDDTLLDTTLLMQEEWLATVDTLQAQLAAVRLKLAAQGERDALQAQVKTLTEERDGVVNMYNVMCEKREAAERERDRWKFACHSDSEKMFEAMAARDSAVEYSHVLADATRAALECVNPDDADGLRAFALTVAEAEFDIKGGEKEKATR